LLLTGGILMTVFLLWFAANSQQTARPVARALLQGLALSLTQAIENLAARDPSFKTLSGFRYRDIAYFALIDRSGRVRFHQNPELAGEIVADDRYLPAFSAAAPVENRIRLGTGEEVYECHLPLHLPGETLVLRLVLHTWQADQVINRARTGATILLTVTASAWVLGFLEEVLFAGAAMAEARRLIGNVADTPASVLISGESGTGKELAARMIHLASQRREAAFVAINCAAIPENLMESELFGHEKGAFTGATQARPGKFELAAGGTLFLDEIGELPLALQAKLLRVLQERTFERLGGRREIRADVRIVAATNRELETEIREKRFREDLYYRLNVFPIHLPPLRERRDGLPILTEYLVLRAAQQIGRIISVVEPEVHAAFAGYDWPGNIRELQNVIERAVILSSGRITLGDLPEPIRRPVKPPWVATDGSLQDLEREAILEMLAQCDGNRRLAAERLKISKRTLQYRLKEYGVVDG